MTMRMSATEPFDVYHLRPLMHPLVAVAHRARLSSFGSLPAVCGSVMENPERIVPASSGSSQRSRMSWRPVISMPTASSSALPESGALFPKTSGPYGDWPRISCMSPSRT